MKIRGRGTPILCGNCGQKVSYREAEDNDGNHAVCLSAPVEAPVEPVVEPEPVNDDADVSSDEDSGE